MTDGGSFLLHSGACLGKLGSCGLKVIEYPGEDRPSDRLICGKVPGGALFCDYLGCYRYHDDTEKFERLPQLNQERFNIFSKEVCKLQIVMTCESHPSKTDIKNKSSPMLLVKL